MQARRSFFGIHEIVFSAELLVIGGGVSAHASMVRRRMTRVGLRRPPGAGCHLSLRDRMSSAFATNSRPGLPGRPMSPARHQ